MKSALEFECLWYSGKFWCFFCSLVSSQCAHGFGINFGTFLLLWCSEKMVSALEFLGYFWYADFKFWYFSVALVLWENGALHPHSDAGSCRWWKQADASRPLNQHQRLWSVTRQGQNQKKGNKNPLRGEERKIIRSNPSNVRSRQKIWLSELNWPGNVGSEFREKPSLQNRGDESKGSNLLQI